MGLPAGSQEAGGGEDFSGKVRILRVSQGFLEVLYPFPPFLTRLNLFDNSFEDPLVMSLEGSLHPVGGFYLFFFLSCRAASRARRAQRPV